MRGDWSPKLGSMPFVSCNEQVDFALVGLGCVVAYCGHGGGFHPVPCCKFSGINQSLAFLSFAAQPQAAHKAGWCKSVRIARQPNPQQRGFPKRRRKRSSNECQQRDLFACRNKLLRNFQSEGSSGAMPSNQIRPSRSIAAYLCDFVTCQCLDRFERFGTVQARWLNSDDRLFGV